MFQTALAGSGWFAWCGFGCTAGRGQWQVEAEGAAAARVAMHGDLAAELGGDLTADGQAQPGAAVAAAGGAVALLER